MARSAKKATKTIRQQLTELKRQQRERMKAAGETPQSLKKKRDQRRAEAARPRTSKASRTTPNGETTVPKRPGKDLIKSKPRQLPARLKDLDTPKELRNKFPVKKGTSIGRKPITSTMNKHKRRSFKKYRGQGKR